MYVEVVLKRKSIELEKGEREMDNQEYNEPTREIVLRRLEILPNTIKKLQIDMMNLQDKINDVEFDIKNFKNEVMQKVLLEKDNEDKSKYKTVQMREIEVDRRLKNDEKYKGLSYKIADQARRLKEKNIEVEFVENKFKSARIMARLIEEKKE